MTEDCENRGKNPGFEDVAVAIWHDFLKMKY
jgi:hypothetical protein